MEKPRVKNPTQRVRDPGGWWVDWGSVFRFLMRNLWWRHFPKDGRCCHCGYTGPEEKECPALTRPDEIETCCEHWWDGPDSTI